MNYLVYGAILYLVMTVIVQYDNSHIKFRTACWNVFVGPIVYVLLYPCFLAVHTYIGIREWIFYTYQGYKLARRGNGHAGQNSNQP
jgi:hypothetical protein